MDRTLLVGFFGEPHHAFLVPIDVSFNERDTSGEMACLMQRILTGVARCTGDFAEHRRTGRTDLTADY